MHYSLCLHIFQTNIPDHAWIKNRGMPDFPPSDWLHRPSLSLCVATASPSTQQPPDSPPIIPPFFLCTHASVPPRGFSAASRVVATATALWPGLLRLKGLTWISFLFLFFSGFALHRGLESRAFNHAFDLAQVCLPSIRRMSVTCHFCLSWNEI